MKRDLCITPPKWFKMNIYFEVMLLKLIKNVLKIDLII
jgi:hypothetical protein